MSIVSGEVEQLKTTFLCNGKKIEVKGEFPERCFDRELGYAYRAKVDGVCWVFNCLALRNT